MKMLGCFLVVALCLLSSCEDKEKASPAFDVTVDNTTVGVPTLIDVTEQIFPLDLAEGQEAFDWESLDFIPSPSVLAPIPLPWSPIANRAFSNDIANDYHAADGWELYYANFSSEFRQGIVLFSLYNQYTGIIRLYVYYDGLEDGSGNYNLFTNTIYSAGGYSNESPLLNFSDQHIVDVDEISDLAVTLEAFPLTANTWYAFEYELAFDKNIYSHSNDDINMGFAWQMQSGANPEIFGQVANVITTKFTIADPDYVYGENYDGPVSLIVQGTQDVNALDNPLQARDAESLKKAFKNNEYDAVLNGIVKSDETGNIKWPAHGRVILNPTSLGLGNVSFSVGGADNSSMQGLGVFRNRAPGVFYLDTKPMVAKQLQKEAKHPYVYTLDVASVEYVFNPAVLEVADITNLRQELIATETDQLDRDNTEAARFYAGQKLTSNLELFIQGVRVSFDVQPKNSQKTFHIIKTFRADVIED